MLCVSYIVLYVANEFNDTNECSDDCVNGGKCFVYTLGRLCTWSPKVPGFAVLQVVPLCPWSLVAFRRTRHTLGQQELCLVPLLRCLMDESQALLPANASAGPVVDESAFVPAASASYSYIQRCPLRYLKPAVARNDRFLAGLPWIRFEAILTACTPLYAMMLLSRCRNLITFEFCPLLPTPALRVI